MRTVSRRDIDERGPYAVSDDTFSGVTLYAIGGLGLPELLIILVVLGVPVLIVVVVLLLVVRRRP